MINAQALLNLLAGGGLGAAASGSGSSNPSSTAGVASTSTPQLSLNPAVLSMLAPAATAPAQQPAWPGLPAQPAAWPAAAAGGAPDLNTLIATAVAQQLGVATAVGGNAADGGRAQGSRSRQARGGDDRDASRSVSPDKRRRLRAHKSDQSAGDGGRKKEKDDAKRLSNKYKYLGKRWLHGDGVITPKDFRVSMIVGCDSDRCET